MTELCTTKQADKLTEIFKHAKITLKCFLIRTCIKDSMDGGDNEKGGSTRSKIKAIFGTK